MELSEQSVAEEIPGAGSSREIFVDQDLAQHDKVRGLGEAQSYSSKRDHGEIATASCSLCLKDCPFFLLPRNHLLLPRHSARFGHCSFYPK